MDKIITVAIIGCGGRGCRTYGRLIRDSFADKFKVVALCDINPSVLNLQKEKLGIDPENTFLNEQDFFSRKRADLLIVATQDRDHARMTLAGMKLGYDVLVEKPLSSSEEECLELLKVQKETGRKVMVCHVLRYAPAYAKVEEILNSGVIGRVVSITALEQVNYVHYAHSFVRGNWHSEKETSPMILAKCCHDLDLIQHYAGSGCASVSSFGDLTWFKPENAPDSHAERCIDCEHIDTCPYSAKQIYLDNWKKNPGYVFSSIMTYPHPLNEEEILNGLRTGKYGRCVYGGYNDVVDHQMVSMLFDNGVTATLTMMAFTGNGGRDIRIFGTHGDIHFSEDTDTLDLFVHGVKWDKWKLSDLIKCEAGSHAGGDYMLIKDLYEVMSGQKEAPTSLEESVESHLIGIAAEKSRHSGGKLIPVHCAQ